MAFDEVGEAASAAGSDPELKAAAICRTKFITAMDDDFNTGGAIGELYEMVHALNRFANNLTPDSSREIAEYRAGMVVLKELTQILGLFRRPVPR